MCSNYRGISLLDIAAKVSISVLLRRIHAAQGRRTRPTQSGFRPGRSCVDHIFNLRRSLEIRRSYQQPTIVCFVDFTTAFDSVDRLALWRMMEVDGILPKLLRLIKAYYSATRTRVRAAGQETTSFEEQSGVRQGNKMSPTLFNYAIDFVLERTLLGSQGIQVGENLYLTDLTYVDDIALLGDSAEAVQDALNNIDRFAKVVGLRINSSKTKVMSTQLRPGTQHTINLGGVPLEEVESFKYLCSSFTATGQAKDEISGSIGLVRSAFARLKSAL